MLVRSRRNVALRASNTAIRKCDGPSAIQYEAIYQTVQRATDEGSLIKLYETSKNKYLKSKDPNDGFTLALSYQIISKLNEHGYKLVPNSGLNEDLVRRILLKAIKDERISGYPLAVYARHVLDYREPGMAPPEEKLLRQGTMTLSTGKKVPYKHYLVLSDKPRHKRVRQLVEQALAIEPDNKFALYMSTVYVKEPRKAIELCWKSIDRPGKRLWEFDALYKIKKLAKGDKETLLRVQEWAAEAKRIVGDTPRAKIRGF